MISEEHTVDFIITNWVVTIDSKDNEIVSGTTQATKGNWPYNGTKQQFEIDKFYTIPGVQGLFAKSGSAVLELA